MAQAKYTIACRHIIIDMDKFDKQSNEDKGIFMAKMLAESTTLINESLNSFGKDAKVLSHSVSFLKNILYVTFLIEYKEDLKIPPQDLISFA